MSETDFVETVEEFKRFKEEMQNPLVMGAMLHKLSEEKSSTNQLFKELVTKLDKLSELEKRLAKIESILQQEPEKRVLSETDEEIVSLISMRGKACAEEVQKQFNYKGTNAASARLNNLVRQGVLNKVQAGKKVFFLPVSLQK